MTIGKSDKSVIGGDFTANVERKSGKYGMGRMNDVGRDWIERCEEHELM